jgi:hypothetical protein
VCDMCFFQYGKVIGVLQDEVTLVLLLLICNLDVGNFAYLHDCSFRHGCVDGEALQEKASCEDLSL